MLTQQFLPLGQVVMTQGVIVASGEANGDPVPWLTQCIARHHSGDWGDIEPEDAALNDQAVVSGGRVISGYGSPVGLGMPRIWIITEADRSETTILLPEEY